jgi:hypothetical protein
MNSRIRIGSRVSTEGWRFDITSADTLVKNRWSYKIFGDQWVDSRVFGSVLGKIGCKWQVKWDIDQDISVFEGVFLQKEDDDIALQKIGTYI